MASKNLKNINPMGNIYSEFIKILKNLTIKYTSEQKKLDTVEISLYAGNYLEACDKTDSFTKYTDYTEEELKRAGFEVGNTYPWVHQYLTNGNTDVIPREYHTAILEERRNTIIWDYEEQNDYVRMLNGLPPIDETNYFYIDADTASSIGFDPSIPLHEIQDYYNHEDFLNGNPIGTGDYYIYLLEGTGIIDTLIANFPDDTYLKYIGSNRIPIKTIRTAKNFSIIQSKKTNVNTFLFDEFLEMYEKCREYTVSTLYIADYRSFIDHYDNFIAMAIFLMTIQQIVCRHSKYFTKREYFDKWAIQTLYECYSFPYNINIDDDTQQAIINNINLFIQRKSTNKVIYDMAAVLGLNNLNVYKYYLVKEHKEDEYGVPIMKEHEVFNVDTGEMEVKPDYQMMYNVYFQKEELREDNFIDTYQDASNTVPYEYVTGNDPFWWEDTNLAQRVWETEYNAVITKYLSLGLSYKITDIVFDNVLLMKLVMQQEDALSDIFITLPKITGANEIPILDVIVALIALTAARHNIRGEIITKPSHVAAVLDYNQNLDDGVTRIPYQEYMENINDGNTGKYAHKVDTFSFNFDYFSADNEEGRRHLDLCRHLLPEADYQKLVHYMTTFSINSDATNAEKIEAFNAMYDNIKSLYKFLLFLMENCTDRATYECLKQMYRSIFYAREMSELFKMECTHAIEHTRAAYTYAEFLHYRNPTLFNALFEYSDDESYRNYLADNNIYEEEMSLEEYLVQVDLGNIRPDYGAKIKGSVADDVDITRERIYFFINHIISQMEDVIYNADYVALMMDSNAPIQDLMLRMVKFIKSFTVDVLDFDIIYVMDLKPENFLHLFDEIPYKRKVIEPKDHMRFNYADLVSSIGVTMWERDYMKLKELTTLYGLLRIDKMNGLIPHNMVRLEDMVEAMRKILEADESLTLEEFIASVNENLMVQERFHLRDTVMMYYSD